MKESRPEEKADAKAEAPAARPQTIHESRIAEMKRGIEAASRESARIEVDKEAENYRWSNAVRDFKQNASDQKAIQEKKYQAIPQSELLKFIEWDHKSVNFDVIIDKNGNNKFIFKDNLNANIIANKLIVAGMQVPAMEKQSYGGQDFIVMKFTQEQVKKFNLEAKMNADREEQKEKKKQEEDEENEMKRKIEQKVEPPKVVQVIEAKVSEGVAHSPVAKTQVEPQHSITRLGETFTYETKLDADKLSLENTKCPSAKPFPNDQIIAYIQDQIMESKRALGQDKIQIDVPNNTSEDLKHAYKMICHANNVEFSVGGVKQEIQKDDKKLNEARRQVLNDMEMQLQELYKELKQNKVPADFAAQMKQMKTTAETMQKAFKSSKDTGPQEMYAASLIRMCNRMNTMAEAVTQAEQKKSETAKVAATVTPPVLRGP